MLDVFKNMKEGIREKTKEYQIKAEIQRILSKIMRECMKPQSKSRTGITIREDK